MNKDLLLAKVRRWKAELVETIETLNGEGQKGPIVDMLDRRLKEMDELISTVEENSFIPSEMKFEPEPVFSEIKDKVKRVKLGVKKIKKLADEKEKILEDLAKDDH